MGRDSDSWIGILLGILGLVALAKILDENKCKFCGANNSKDTINCKNCGSFLK